MDQNIPIESQTKDQVPVTPMPAQVSDNNFLKYIALGIALIILVGIGAFVVGSNSAYNSSCENRIETSQVATTPTTAPLKNNKYIINNEHGYSITHSGDLRISGQGMDHYTDPSFEDAISIFDERLFSNTQLYPFMQIVAFEPDKTNYNVSTLSEIAEANLKENSENPNIPITIIEPLSESTFKEKKAYKYTFECQGFGGIYESMMGPKGICKMIFTEHQGKYFFIGYYSTSEFEDIVKSFKFM